MAYLAPLAILAFLQGALQRACHPEACPELIVPMSLRDVEGAIFQPWRRTPVQVGILVSPRYQACFLS